MKYLLITLLLINVQSLFGQQSFVLNASAPSVYNGDSIILKIWDYYSLNQYKYVKSEVINNDKFSFSGPLNKPCENAILYIRKDGMEKFYMQFVVDTGLNNIEIKNASTDYREYKSNVVFHSVSNTIDKKLDSLNNVYYKDKQSISLQERINLNKEITQVLQQYHSEYYSLIVLRSMANMAGRKQQPLLQTFNTFDEKLRSTLLGRETDSILISEINAINGVKAGSRAPVFSVNTDNGIPFTNKTLLGQPYVIAFSATWCIPCQVSQKKLLFLYHKYRNNGLKVIYFNLDNNVAIWKKKIKDKKLDWINVSERTKFANSKIARRFYANAIPLYIVVDKKGKIIYNDIQSPDDHAHNKLEKYIKEAIN